MYDAHPIVDGFPGKTATHGSFGWSSVWLLHDGDSAVLVDTGPPSYVPLIVHGLAAHGLAPADVTDVLLTHSHWDHVGCVSMFPRARRWIGRVEFSWARRQPMDVPFVSQPLLAALGEPESALRLIDGDGEILPGIRACEVPGHTPGHVAFLAETTRGPLLFVGDAAKNVRELGARVIDSALDRQVADDSITRINDIASGAGARVVPGHDVLCSLSEDGWRRERAQTAQMQFHHRRDEEPLVIAINDRDPALVSVRSSDAIES
jgi:glyoxylase-like metal-dependent hydrolase (beta-lactamase superfamily II)